MSAIHASAPVPWCMLVEFLQRVLVSCSLLWDLCFPRTAMPPRPRSDRAAPPALSGLGRLFPCTCWGPDAPAMFLLSHRKDFVTSPAFLGMFGAHLVSAFVSEKCEGLFAWKHSFETASLREGHVSPAVFPSPVQAICIPLQVNPQRAACPLFTKLMSMCKWCLTPAPK